MKYSFSILLTLMIFCSGGFAQGPNSFSIALDKKVTNLITVPCGEKGFCIVTEKKTKEHKQLKISHYDTTMRSVFDTMLTLPVSWAGQHLFYENGALVIYYQEYLKKHFTPNGALFFYHPDSKTLEKQNVTGLPAVDLSAMWRHYQGNLICASAERSYDMVWFLPAGATQPMEFSFTRDNPGRVLTTAVDTAQGKAIICFATGDRTAYFETDFYGRSSFANILNEPATNAQWIGIGRNHSVLMLYYHDDETFYMHPVNILNHKVMPSESIYCADILAPKTLPTNVLTKHTIIIPPHNYISFLPSHASLHGDRISCITELYYPEYYNYFNGWYVEPRFSGYRYERADVHFFDTNGVFKTNITFPYGEEGDLHSRVLYKLNIESLQNNDLLLYHIDNQGLTTMLLDSTLQLKDPVRTDNLPLPNIPFKKQKILVDRLIPWYSNKFLLTNFRINVISQRKTAFDVRALEYR